MTQYHNHLGRLASAWSALEDFAYGAPLPDKFIKAIAFAKQDYLGADFTQKRDTMMKKLVAGEDTGMTTTTWTPMAIAKLSSLLSVAEAALDAAKDHAAEQRADARSDLIIDLAVLALALALAIGAVMTVTRRVIRPLHAIQGAMLKVAGGDLSVDVAFTDRKDEIGALATALGTFKHNAEEKTHI
jgi:methyl-accepting chemotaxis protein